jgi:hypothetical protein
VHDDAITHDGDLEAQQRCPSPIHDFVEGPGVALLSLRTRPPTLLFDAKDAKTAMIAKKIWTNAGIIRPVRPLPPTSSRPRANWIDSAGYDAPFALFASFAPARGNAGQSAAGSPWRSEGFVTRAGSLQRARTS